MVNLFQRKVGYDFDNKLPIVPGTGDRHPFHFVGFHLFRDKKYRDRLLGQISLYVVSLLLQVNLLLLIDTAACGCANI